MSHHWQSWRTTMTMCHINNEAWWWQGHATSNRVSSFCHSFVNWYAKLLLLQISSITHNNDNDVPRQWLRWHITMTYHINNTHWRRATSTMTHNDDIPCQQRSTATMGNQDGDNRAHWWWRGTATMGSGHHVHHYLETRWRLELLVCYSFFIFMFFYVLMNI